MRVKLRGTMAGPNGVHHPGEIVDLCPQITRAIGRACRKAGVPVWTPHRLRHNAATVLRKEFGLDVARVICGHKSPLTTEMYAELDRSKARDVMKQIG